jgi:hypothetical protein
MLRLTCLAFASICIASPAFAFHGGHTGVTEQNLRAACPAFGTGTFSLLSSVSPPGTSPLVDVFEHDSGARCQCTRLRTAERSLRCGPTAPQTRS